MPAASHEFGASAAVAPRSRHEASLPEHWETLASHSSPMGAEVRRTEGPSRWTVERNLNLKG